MNEILNVNSISLKYQAKNGEIEALENVSFSVESGEFVSIVGPSGCGKTTLLSVISGLIKPTKGSVTISGDEVNGISQKVGYMLQNDNLLEWKTIFKNAVFGLKIQHKLNDESIEYVKKLLKKYNLEEFKDKYPSQLSGGMRQRAALIRTLAIKPDILLLDEAFSALDYQTRLSVTEYVYKMLKKENTTSILVTHDIPEAISLSDRIIVLTNRPGSIKSIHTIAFDETVLTPLERRNNPKFSTYFNTIWKELDVYEYE